MKLNELDIPGVFEIQLTPHRDHRGFFARTYDRVLFEEKGLHVSWVQENQSFTRENGSIRGLHFQYPPFEEIKIVRPVTGKVFFVIVDLRKSMGGLGKWCSIILDSESMNGLYIPGGCALGNCTLSPDVNLVYKMGNIYKPYHAGVIQWDDPDLGIAWPVDRAAVISDRDKHGMSLKQFISEHGGF